MNKVKQFVDMSKYAGMREDLIQAGGGNSSVKLEKNKMLIKASGIQLADLTEETGYAVVNPQIINDFFYGKSLNDISDDDEETVLNNSLLSGMRPSIETFLHSITDVFTLHTHPMVVNVLTSRKDGMSVLKGLFPGALLVDYATPGIKLAKEYFKAYKENIQQAEEIFDVIFLKNHGLIVSAKTGTEVIQKTEEVLLRMEEYLTVDMLAHHDVTKLYDGFTKTGIINKGEIIYLSNDINIKNATRKFKSNLWKIWFCPDCLIYCGKRPLSLTDEFGNGMIEQHKSEYGDPVIIYYKENIYVVASSVKKAKEIESVLSFSAQVAILNDNFEMDLLSETEQNFLLNWESEKYRQNLK